MAEEMTDAVLDEIRERAESARTIVDARTMADFRLPLDEAEEAIRALVQEDVPRVIDYVERLRAQVEAARKRNSRLWIELGAIQSLCEVDSPDKVLAEIARRAFPAPGELDADVDEVTHDAARTARPAALAATTTQRESAGGE